MPSATYTHSAVAAQAIDVVWGRLQEAPTWSEIGPIDEVTDPVHVEGALQSFRWAATVGPSRYRATATVLRSDPPNLMRVRLDAGEVTGDLEARLEPDGDDHTAVHITLQISSRGILSTMFFPAISQAVGQGLPDQVAAFAASFTP